jgi:hypothetical protein
MLQRVLDVATAIALTAAVVFVIVAGNNLLMPRGGAVAGFRVWYGFIARPEILSTMILTAVVSFAYVFWQQSRGRKV